MHGNTLNSASYGVLLFHPQTFTHELESCGSTLSAFSPLRGYFTIEFPSSLQARNMCFLFFLISSYFPLMRETDNQKAINALGFSPLGEYFMIEFPSSLQAWNISFLFSFIPS